MQRAPGQSIYATRRILRALAIGVVCLLAAAGVSLAQSDSTRHAGEAAAADATLPAGAGQRVYIDPETGQMATPPESDQVAVPRGAASVPSTAGLVEEPLPAGGFKLDTKGRFQVPLRATTNADGEVIIQHGASPGDEQP